MRVILAKNAGACYGVKRAIGLAIGAAGDGAPAYTIGPLIHNPGAVADLELKGVHVVGSLDDVAEGTLVIRSHGVTPEVFDAVHEKGLPVVDATCPHVARAQKAAAMLANQGCRVIVVGEAGHPEVEGLRAYAKREGTKVDVVSKPDDVPDDLRAPIGVVVQTTQRRENLEAVVARIKSHCKRDHMLRHAAAPRCRGVACVPGRCHGGHRRQELVQYDALVRNLQGILRKLASCRIGLGGRCGLVCQLQHRGRDRGRIDAQRANR